MMNCNGSGRKPFRPTLHGPKVAEEDHENHIEDSLYPGRDSKRRSVEYESGM
jgi:hypothetical protein